jgi:predicted dehydrogenase
MSPPEGLRLAFYGAGTVTRDHAEAAHALGAVVCAGSTRSQDSENWGQFHEQYPKAKFEEQPQNFATRNDIDAIVVALPWDKQDDALDWALGCPKPILIEKPIASNSSLLRRMLERHSSTQENKLVGYNRRYYQTLDALRQRIAAGGLRAANITISEDVSRLRKGRGPALLSEYLVNSSCHILDAAISLFGPLKALHITRNRQQFDGMPFDSFNGLLSTVSGIPVCLNCNAYDPAPVGIDCRFDDGTRWCLSPMERLRVFEGYDVIERSDDCQIRRYEPHLVDEIIEDASLRPGFVRQMRAFLTNDFGPGCRPADALHLLDLTEQIKATAKEPTQ